MENAIKLSFSIQGEFITDLAREKFYIDNDLAGSLKLLLNSLCSDQISDEERLGIAISILNGTKSIVGTYPGDDYRVIDTVNDQLNPNFMDHLTDILTQFNDMKDQLTEAYSKIGFLYDALANSVSSTEFNKIKTAYENEFNEKPEKLDTSDDMLDYYMKRTNDDNTLGNNLLEDFIDSVKRASQYDYNLDEDYGWLAPDGDYSPVKWGYHTDWAEQYLKDHYSKTEKDNLHWNIDSNGHKYYMTAGDVLLKVLHFALLDNPSKGNAILTYDESFGLTKSQKDFLYKYYKDRGFDDKANNLYNED